MTLIPLGGYVPGPPPVISPDTGLLGVPEQTQSGIEMRTLLNPNLKVGQLIQLIDSSVNLLRFPLDISSVGGNFQFAPQYKTNTPGFYYVMCANHSGNTRGNEWYTDLVCLGYDASITGDVPGLKGVLPESAIPAVSTIPTTLPGD